MAEAGQPIGGESSLSNWAAPYVTDMLGKGWGLSETPYTPYEGPLTAGPSALQNQAFSGIAGLAVPGGGTYDPTAFTSGTWDANTATQYMNPFIQSALNPQLDEARRQAEMSRMQQAGRMTQAGAFGGSRQAIMEAELDRNLQSNLSDITGTGYRDAYDRGMQAFQTDAGRSLQAQGMGEQSKQFGADFGIRSLDAGRNILSDQLRAGDIQRGIESEGIVADMKQFEQERDYPFKMTQFMQSLLQGMPIQAQNYSYVEPSNFQQFLGGAGGVLELLNALRGTQP
jgi:hypothetical protein